MWRHATILAVLLLGAGGLASGQECPQLLGRWGYGPPTAVTASASSDLVVFGSGTTVQVADFADPRAPVVLGELDLGRLLRRLALSGSLAYALPLDGGLLVLDLSDPASPRLAGELEAVWAGERLALGGGHLLVAAGDSGLRVVDVGDPASPVEVGDLQLQGGVWDVAVAGTWAYLLGVDALWVADLADPARPAVTTSRPFDGPPAAVAVANGRVLATVLEHEEWFGENF